MRSLARPRTDRERMDALNNLPSGLAQTYRQMMNAIGRVREDKEIAMNIMTWILYAARRLRLDELAVR